MHDGPICGTQASNASYYYVSKVICQQVENFDQIRVHGRLIREKSVFVSIISDPVYLPVMKDMVFSRFKRCALEEHLSLNLPG